MENISTQHENAFSMNKIFCWFVGWIGGLFALAKAPVPFLDWVPHLQVDTRIRDFILLCIAAVKGGFLAVTSWLFLLGARRIRVKILRSWKRRKK